MVRRTLLLFLLTLSALAAATAQGLWDWTVYLRHSGPIRYGMSIADAKNALGDPLAHADREGCDYLQSARLPDSVLVMVEDGRVVRIEIQARGIKTSSGAGIGDTEDRIKSLFPGRIVVSPHKYTDGHYLTFVPADRWDRGYRIVFETDGQHVTEFRAGLTPQVLYVEGCS